MENTRELKYRNFSISTDNNEPRIEIELDDDTIINFTKSPSECLDKMEDFEEFIDEEDEHEFNWGKFFYRLTVVAIIALGCFIIFLLIMIFPSIISYFKNFIDDCIYDWRELLGINKPYIIEFNLTLLRGIF